MNDNVKPTDLGDLPAEWEVVPVGNSGKVVTGSTPSTKKPEYYDGPYMFIAPGDMGHTQFVTKTEKYLSQEGLNVSRTLPKNSVLVVCIGATIGKTGMTSAEESATNQQINAIIPNEKNSPHFLYFALTQRAPYLPDLAGRAAVPIVNKSNFSKFPIPLPPLDEQRKIAYVLNSVQQAIAAQADLIAAAQELKRSLLRRLFTYGPGSEPAPTKETAIGEVPVHWEVVELGDYVRAKITDGTHKTPNYISRGVPFVTATNLKNGQIDFSNCKFISEKEHHKLTQRCKPENGDVLLSKVGTLGLVAVVNSDFEFSIFVQVALIKPQLDSFNSHFLKALLQTPSMQGQIVQKASQSTMKYIGIGKIANLVVVKPPLSEQHQIAHILQSADAKIAAEQDRRAGLRELFNSLLQELMTGRLRVNEIAFGKRALKPLEKMVATEGDD